MERFGTVIDKLKGWVVKEDGLYHIKCNGEIEANCSDYTAKSVTQLSCKKCSAIIPKLTLSYFIMAHPNRNWHLIDLDNYKGSK